VSATLGITPSGLAYEIAGSGPPLLLLHAGLMDRRMWDPQWPALTQRFTAIRFDARGFGQSADPDRPYSLHGDALEVLESAGIDRAAVVGVSMGGSTALDLALAAPARVTSLVVVSSEPSGWRHTFEHMRLLDVADAAFERGDIDAANEAEIRIWVDGPVRTADRVDRDIRARVAAMNRVLLERQATFEHEPFELEPPASERLEELRAPALVVTGELDQPSVLEGAFAITAATGARHIEIMDAGHLPNLERPREFLEALLIFLEELAAER
jgi:pimeloyl-ACP methyl ester carboxylesterase